MTMDPDDPTRQRNQAALTRSSGREWLVVGGIMTPICVAVLLFQIPTSFALAVGGSVVVVLIYAAMVIVRLTLRSRRRRLGILAGLLSLIALVTIMDLLLVIERLD